MERDRYITFPSPDSQRIITLHCDIQPGLLSDRYRVKWTKESNTSLTIINEDGPYTITTDVETSDDFCLCTVHIQHRSDDNDEIAYFGRKINIKKTFIGQFLTILYMYI